MIHIGAILHRYFEEHRIRRAALARLMNIRLDSLMRYEKNESIKTHRLLELCTHLKHNFFMDIAGTLPQEYSTSATILEIKNQEIEALKKEVEKLTIENELLKKIIKV